MRTRAEFVALIRSYIGTPYHHQGRLPGVGLDCPGPMICAAWELGLPPRTEDINAYPRSPDGSLRGYCEQYLQPIAFKDAVPGDALLCAFRGGPPRHLGVLTEIGERTYWVHANDNAKHGKVHESRLMFGEQRMTLVQAYRVPGLT